MAINIKAPLVDQLFTIGQAVGSDGHNQFQSPVQNQGSYHGEAHAPMPQAESKGSGGLGALASVGGALGTALMAKGQGAAPVAKDGTGFGLGGTLTAGAGVGGTAYAGSANVNPLMSLFSKTQSIPSTIGGLFGS